MEAILSIATILGGITALWFLWENVSWINFIAILGGVTILWFLWKKNPSINFVDFIKQQFNIIFDKSSFVQSAKNQIMVFQTLDQRTILKATGNGIECYLFDARDGKSSGLQWKISKEQVSFILSDKNYDVVSGLKPKTGLFSIGIQKDLPYSKVLFPKPELLETALTILLEKV